MPYTEYNSDSSAPVSSAGKARIRYNDNTKEFEQSVDGGGWTTLVGAGGGGDMFKATYDPTAVAGDAFDMANMVEDLGGAGSLILTSAERTLIAGALQSVLADAAPQLGGNLDLNGSDVTGTGNVNITGAATVTGDIVTSAGRVGIGTASPTHDLTIESAGSPFKIVATAAVSVGMSLENFSTQGAVFALNDSGAVFISGPSIVNGLIIDGTNIGIDVSSPTEKLHVGGGILIGAAVGTTDGTIRWTGADFEGRKGGAWVSLTLTGGETNTASNVGAGDGVFKGKVGVDFELKSLIGGTNISLTPGTDDITFDVPDATTSVKGAAEIATQAEVDAGVDTSRYVTPATLAGLSGGPFVLSAGVAGGQTIIGGTGAGDDLTLSTTSDVTKGQYIFTDEGAAGAPAIVFDTDLTTGIYSDSGNLSIATFGVQKFEFNATGLQLLNNPAIFDAKTGGIYINGDVSAGTASLPIYSFNGDTDTGIYRVGDDNIGFSTDGTRRADIDADGNVAIGTAALANAATDGFLYIPTMAGVPSGVPTAKTGLVPIVYDTSNNDLYVYNGGWKSVTLT